MNARALECSVDEVAIRDPERGGYGYADTQHPWHHDAAIEHPRDVFLSLLALLRKKARSPTVVQIGLGPGRRAGAHLALRAWARRVVTVDESPDRLAALREQLGADDGRSRLIAGGVDDPAVFAAVRDAAAVCDLLLLDRDSYAGMRDAWQRCAGLVRPGGILALVDRSQAQALDRPAHGVDRFVADLERDVLRPLGVRVERLGGARAIHVYEQSQAALAAEPPAWPSGLPATAPGPRWPAVHGFALHAWNGAIVAVPADGVPFSPQAVERNEMALVLVAADRARMEVLVRAWIASEPALTEARTALAADRDDAARELVLGVVRLFPDLRATLLPCLTVAPWNRALLLAIGTIDLFDGRPRQGVALLQRALRPELTEAGLLRTVAAAYLRVLKDEAGARELLAAVRRRVHERMVAEICHHELRGHVLWQFPTLLAAARGVLQVGATVADAKAWARLEVPARWFVDADPKVCAQIAAADGGATAMACVLGAAPGPATLRSGGAPSRASLLPLHALAVPGGAPPQTQAVAVQLQTLDELMAAGRIDPRACDLLVLDTEGSELDILRGATGLLRHVDTVSVGVFLQPVYDGAPRPEQVQTFLREVFGDADGFHLCAFEPGADGVRGTALFRRRRPRRARR